MLKHMEQNPGELLGHVTNGDQMMFTLPSLFSVKPREIIVIMNNEGSRDVDSPAQVR